MFWPTFTNQRQEYLEISREMNSDSVKNYPFAREYNLWRNIIPTAYKALKDVW